MDRLATKKCGELLIKCNDGEYRSPCFGCESINKCNPEKVTCGFYKALEKLKEYEDLEEQGKLLKLPCTVGDTVYEVQESRKRIQPYIVIAVHVSDCGNLYGWELKDGKGVYSNVNGFSEYALGKSVFIAREEAEAALEDKKSGDKE